MDRRLELPHRLTIGLTIAAVVLLGWTGVSEAFWPFTRSVKAVPDSIQKQDWNGRFEDWRSQVVGDSLAGSGVGLTAAPSPDLDDLLRQAQAEQGGGLDSAADSLQAPAAQDSSQIAAIDSTTTPSEGQDQDQTDALTQARIAAAAAGGFRPMFSAKMTSNNDRMRLDGSLNATFHDPSGVSLTSGMSYGDEYNLNQGTNTRSKGILNTFNLPLRSQGMNFSLTTSNNRRNILGARTTTNERATTATDSRAAGLTASAS